MTLIPCGPVLTRWLAPAGQSRRPYTRHGVKTDDDAVVLVARCATRRPVPRTTSPVCPGRDPGPGDRDRPRGRALQLDERCLPPSLAGTRPGQVGDLPRTTCCRGGVRGNLDCGIPVSPGTLALAFTHRRAPVGRRERRRRLRPASSSEFGLSERRLLRCAPGRDDTRARLRRGRGGLRCAESCRDYQPPSVADSFRQRPGHHRTHRAVRPTALRPRGRGAARVRRRRLSRGRRTDVWMPLPAAALRRGASPDLAQFADPRGEGLRLLAGRLSAGATRASAAAELSVLSRQFRSAAALSSAGFEAIDTRP